jgi:hypothetical protein
MVLPLVLVIVTVTPLVRLTPGTMTVSVVDELMTMHALISTGDGVFVTASADELIANTIIAVMGRNFMWCCPPFVEERFRSP